MWAGCYCQHITVIRQQSPANGRARYRGHPRAFPCLIPKASSTCSGGPPLVHDRVRGGVVRINAPACTGMVPMHQRARNGGPDGMLLAACCRPSTLETSLKWRLKKLMYSCRTARPDCVCKEWACVHCVGCPRSEVFVPRLVQSGDSRMREERYHFEGEKSWSPRNMQYCLRLAAVIAFAVMHLTALSREPPIGLRGRVWWQKRFCCPQERIACSEPKNAMPDASCLGHC